MSATETGTEEWERHVDINEGAALPMATLRDESRRASTLKRLHRERPSRRYSELDQSHQGGFGVSMRILCEMAEKRETELLTAVGGVANLARHLRTDPHAGLSLDEESFEQRHQVFGTNEFPPPPSKLFVQLMFDAAKDTTMLILIVASVVSIILGTTVGSEENGWVEGTAIMVAVVIVVLVTAGNDYSKERQFRRLNAVKEDFKVKVIRGGQNMQVSVGSINVGDVVMLETGDQIPADGVFLEGHNIKCDEASMTGESHTITKTHETPFFIGGCQVVEGVGMMLVIAVGSNSEKGRIKSLLAQEDEETPLQQKLVTVAGAIGKMGLLLAVITFAALVLRFSIKTFGVDDEKWDWGFMEDYVDFFMTGLTIVVVAVPEGLPLAVTIALAYSMMKMLRDNNLVRHLDACETMGGATNICSDKTGTLTENRMTVTAGYVAQKKFDGVPHVEYTMDPSWEVVAEGIGVNSTAYLTKRADGTVDFVGSKTECALLVLLEKIGGNYETVRKDTKILGAVPFSSARKRMSTIVQRQEGMARMHTKGASEIVLGLCSHFTSESGDVLPMKDDVRAAYTAHLTQMASTGLRTLGLAYCDFPDAGAMDWDALGEDVEESAKLENDLVWLGVVGIKDPVRQEVPQAVETCRQAGIIVRMVTGDNILTAQHIARECGILSSDGMAIEGPKFRAMSDEEVDAILPRLQVMARSSPQDKHRLVHRLRHNGEVVAVTGDGTNDAPALKEADVGFSMGIAGTEVAKEASDIVLMDDNFASLVRAVMWGRNVYDSIRKFLQFQLTVTLSAVTISLIGSLANGESPLNPVQLLWVNLIMDTLGALALATAPPTEELLNRKPYGRNDFLITPMMWLNIVGQAVWQIIFIIILLFVGHIWYNGDDSGHLKRDSREHYTLIFNTFVMLQLFNEFNARLLTTEINCFANFLASKIHLMVFIITLIVQALLVQFGGSFTKTKPLDGAGDQVLFWISTIAYGATSLVVGLGLRLLGRVIVPKEVKEVPSKALWAKIAAASVMLHLYNDVKRRRLEDEGFLYVTPEGRAMTPAAGDTRRSLDHAQLLRSASTLGMLRSARSTRWRRAYDMVRVSSSTLP